MKTINGKTFALVAVAIVMVSIITVLAFALILGKESYAQKVIAQFEDGNYSEAYDTYIELYGRGNSDKELESYFYNRILDIEDSFDNSEISYKKAIEELETIEDMRIMSLDDNLNDTMEHIESAHSKATATEDKANTPPPSQNSSSSGTKSPTTTQSYLTAEPLPEEHISTTARITSATTLKGEVLPSSNVNSARSFTANKTIDGYYDSCWCVNTSSKGGAGAQIRFDLAEKSYVKSIAIINGNIYKPEEEIYSLNGQIKNFTLTFSDGTRKSFTAAYNGTASTNYEFFDLGNPIVTDYIILTVDSGYVGSLYTTNVCLGEFKVY